MFCIDVQANDMNFVVFQTVEISTPATRSSASPLRTISARGGNAVSGIVIGYCQRADTHFNGAMDQSFGCQQAI